MIKVGDKFDSLTVIKINNDKTCVCKCDCGNEINLKCDSLRYRKNRNTVFMCQECRNKFKKENSPKIGRRYGKLKVIEFIGNHKYKCLCDCGNYCIVDTKSLRKYNSKRSKTSCGCDVIHYNKNEDYFSEINTEQKAYILGLIASDGCVHENVLKITLKSDDVEILNKIAKEIEYDGPIKIQDIETSLPQGDACKSQSATLAICSKKIVEDLYKFGITENKSKTLNINTDLIPDILIRHFLRGLYDGDGTCNITKSNRISYRISIIGSKNIIYFIINYFKNIFSELNGSISEKNGTYILTYGSKESYKLLSDFLYKDSSIYLERKYQRYLKNLKIIKLIESVKNHTNKQKNIFYNSINFDTGELIRNCND